MVAIEDFLLDAFFQRQLIIAFGFDMKALGNFAPSTLLNQIFPFFSFRSFCQSFLLMVDTMVALFQRNVGCRLKANGEKKV